ncbi:hypothetical protein V1478_018270 [Vespula squamosa]|uniref:Uncharacterized protein n=1 Tax=Vespula squamosa TaxID=30214 RepID=A0ABD1ZUK3_VESSQ
MIKKNLKQFKKEFISRTAFNDRLKVIKFDLFVIAWFNESLKLKLSGQNYTFNFIQLLIIITLMIQFLLSLALEQ